MADAGYIHQTRVLGQEEHRPHHILQTAMLQKRLLVMNGGVVIYSRHPILSQHYAFFQGNDIDAMDAFSMKGFVYVRVKVSSRRIVHIVGTHLQATRTGDGDRMRLKQIYRVNQFLRDQLIPCNEPIILLGDLNQDSYTHTHAHSAAFQKLLSTAELLPVPHQSPHPHGHPATVNPEENNLVGRDTDVTIPISCLDHCTFALTHLRPLLPDSSCITLKPTTREPMTFGMPGVFYRSDMVGITTHHLSDHFALLARLVFPIDNDCIHDHELPDDSFFHVAASSNSKNARLVYTPTTT